MFQQVVNKQLLLLINKISEFQEIFQSFYMAGGTALALQLGHRKSEDVDLFSQKKFDEKVIAEIIQRIGGEITSTYTQTIHGMVNGGKIYFIQYDYKMLQPFDEKLIIDRIRLASVADIACMKIMAISQRAEKKDFYDMYEIMKIYSPAELKENLLEKYNGKVNCYHTLKSFFYFDDIEESAEPVSLNGTKWKDVKNYFLKNEKQITRELLC